MIPAPQPAREPERIAALASCGVLDTAPERSFNPIVQLASRIDALSRFV
jgi:hypothetical protein